jgi:uncharacterized membrane protein YuzA (DUF378 family)
MEKQILIGIIGLAGVYVLYRIISTPERARQVESEDQYTDILTNKKYKVKSQWDR